MIRSTTDEMLAARHDPEPWVGADGSRKSRYSRFAPRFDPRVECIPSRDPKPWVAWGVRYAEKVGTAYWGPRPEFARPEPNPILVAFREHFGEVEGETLAGSAEVEIRLIDEGHWADDATHAEIEDARKVLTRFPGVFS